MPDYIRHTTATPVGSRGCHKRRGSSNLRNSPSDRPRPRAAVFTVLRDVDPRSRCARTDLAPGIASSAAYEREPNKARKDVTTWQC